MISNYWGHTERYPYCVLHCGEILIGTAATLSREACERYLSFACLRHERNHMKVAPLPWCGPGRMVRRYTVERELPPVKERIFVSMYAGRKWQVMTNT